MSETVEIAKPRVAIVVGFGQDKPVPFDEYNIKRERGLNLVKTTIGQPVRKFGFFWNIKESHLPMPARNAGTEEDKRAFRHLRDIEMFAGYIDMQQHQKCCICDLHGIGHVEYVFKPTPSGSVYRWPNALMHYHDCHNIKSPDWLRVMVIEFLAAQAAGYWKP